MKNDRQAIEPLKKVTLQVSAGKRPTGDELMSAAPVEFIFGLGKTGLTPLERHLEGKTAGRSLSLELNRSCIPEFFGHIFSYPLDVQTALDPFYLNLKIMSVSAVNPREVIRAMADMTACGGCDCGCGGPS